MTKPIKISHIVKRFSTSLYVVYKYSCNFTHTSLSSLFWEKVYQKSFSGEANLLDTNTVAIIILIDSYSLINDVIHEIFIEYIETTDFKMLKDLESFIIQIQSLLVSYSKLEI